MILIGAVFWLAWSNGANDNFKGVATLYGSGAMTFRGALIWATVATAAGSLVSIALAGALATAFSGKGIVSPELAGSSALLISVGAAAAITIMLATILGMPTSTTHALTGALLGIAVMIGHGQADFAKLWSSFFLPLLASPFMAVGASALLYVGLRAARRRLGVSRRTCVCIGVESPQSVQRLPDGSAVMAASAGAARRLTVGSEEQCIERYEGNVIGFGAQTIIERVHAVSGTAVCFARAVNDAPKIAALLLATGMHALSWKLGLVAVAMTAGGWVQSKKVAETMSKRITNLNPGQGLTANLVTAGLVLGASRFGLPVSTTHVSCGSIFGIGAARRSARLTTITQIILTWLTTLPLGAVLGAALYWVLSWAGI